MRCVDLFCGCGGLSLGFQNQGFEIVAAFDNWDKSIEVYRNNFKHDSLLFDLTDIKGAVDIIKNINPEIIIGGPPCQDFSSAGKRDETNGKADLTYKFADIVCDYNSKYFVMENVERIKKSHILKDIISQFNKEGYGLTAVILNASYCGVPQARNRFFLIGELDGLNNAFMDIIRSNLEDHQMTVRDYFGESLGLEYYYRHPRNYDRRGIFSIDEPSPTVRGVNRPVPGGYKKHSGDPEGAVLKQVRPLTTIERSYIQTFPSTFKFNGTKTNLEQMIGNAVPVNLASFVGRCIIQYLNGDKVEAKQGTLFNKNNEIIFPSKSLLRL